MTHGHGASGAGDPTILGARVPLVAAGIVDVSAASAATFVCGLLAARLLEAHELGAYSLAFRVLVLAMTVPSALVFQAREVQAVQAPEPDRLGLFLPGMFVGVPVAVVTALLAALWPLSFPGGVADSTIRALNITMCLVAALSPLQDFLRRMLHLSGRSWHAARVSLIQLGVVIASWAIAGLGSHRYPLAWLPFGILALANAVSMMVGVILARRAIARPAPRLVEGGDDLLKSGALLLFIGMLPSVVGVLAGVILARVSGPDVLGYLEAARVVAQPILVFGIGLSAVLGPRSMRAARARERGEARRLAWQFSAAVLGLGIVYAIFVGFPNPLNVLAWLIPKAYTVSGVVLLTIAGHVALSLAMPRRSEMLGAGRIGSLAWIEAISNVVNVACASLAAVIGIFALPLGTLAQGLIRLVLLHVQNARLYRKPLDGSNRRPGASSPISGLDWPDGPHA